MARLKFLCDVERCIDCSGCVVACKEGNHIPVGVNRRRVVTLNQGKPGEKSISVSCMHCADAPCIAVCPVDAIYQREDGVVLVSKKTCIGCGYCFMACPFGAPQFPKGAAFGARGAMAWPANGEAQSIEPGTLARVVDTVGAGDAFTAVVLAGLISGWPIAITLTHTQTFANAICAVRGATVRDRGFYERHTVKWEL